MKQLLAVTKSIVIVAALAVSGAAVSACNTIEGVGEDISTAGKGISRGARDVKNGD
jgi:predicted small secreted protein